MEQCSQCGAQLEPGYRFCGDCGASLAGCPACGAPTLPGKKFCIKCGQALTDSTPLPARQAAAPSSVPGPAPGQGAAARPEPVAERRLCSVLFCDVVGFTPLSESRDPEAVRELLSRYFEVARTVIGRYGGVVEKFIGDAVMAVWGTPVAAEGDAERCVRAALDVVAAVSQLGEEAGVPGLAARAGVVTGEVAVTIGATGEGMVAGDAVNTASRVQVAAEAGQVLVDVATFRLASGSVGFESAGEHVLKGKTEPMELWRATRVLSGIRGSQRVDGLEAPITGRDAELRTVRELFHAAAERRVPRLVLVSGPAGVGKSRLGWEFEKYIDGLKELMFWHRGRCLSYGDGAAFWALAEIVRARLGIAEEDPAASAASKLAAGLDRFITDPAERGYVGVRLGRLLGVSFADDSGGQLSRQELFAGWRLFFERLAADSPVILVIEDAQHADTGLLDFLDHLIDWARNLPIYVVVLARPELELTRPGFGTGRNRTTLTLDPLDPASMDKLVDALVPDMPPSAREAVTSQAQGIPLFAVETVRSLIDRDIVQPSGGVYRLVGDVGELAVPDSLHALLAARLDALEPAVRRLVTDAAVLGSTFPAEALIAVSGRKEAVVRAALDELVRREVLSVSADRLSPERGSYRFAQTMLRQVAYDTLSRRDRKTRHLAVAAHLRAVFAGDGEEITDVVARHYLDALEAVPEDPDVADIRGQAAGTLVRAADRAMRTGAPVLAASSYAAAAELAEQGVNGVSAQAGQAEHGAAADPEDATPARYPNGDLDAGTLWERAARAALDGGDRASASTHAGRARDFHAGNKDARGAARARTLLGEGLRHRGRTAEAREELIGALEVLRTDPDVDTVTALSRLADVETFAGSAEADQLTMEALILGQALDVDAKQLGDLFVGRAIYLRTQDRRPEAAAYLREHVRLATQIGDSFEVGLGLLNLSDAEVSADPAAAADDARAAVVHCRRAGASRLLATAIVNLAQALLMLGDWDAAASELETAAEADGLGGADYILIGLGQLAALRGDAAAAQTRLDALGDLRTSEDPQDNGNIRTLQAFIAVARDQPGEALVHARAALVFGNTLGMTADSIRWAWPIATRAAWTLGDSAVTSELLAMLDACQPGQLSRLLIAERELARARLVTPNGGEGADASFAAAIRGLREHGTPYHLAHGLLDHASHLRRAGDSEAAGAAIEEAREIGQRLRCQPLLDRAAAATGSKSLVRA